MRMHVTKGILTDTNRRFYRRTHIIEIKWTNNFLGVLFTNEYNIYFALLMFPIHLAFHRIDFTQKFKAYHQHSRPIH